MILYELILYKVCGLSVVLFCFFAYGYSIVSLICFKKPILPPLSILLSFVKNQLTVRVWTYLWLLYLFFFIDLCIYSSIRHIILNTVVI